MEEVNCENLLDLVIANKEIKTISWKLRYRVVLQLAEALRYLHFHDCKLSPQKIE